MMVHYANLRVSDNTACEMKVGKGLWWTAGVSYITCPFCLQALKDGGKSKKEHGVLLSNDELDSLLNDNEIKKTWGREPAFGANRKGVYVTLVWELTKKSKTVFIGVGYIGGRWEHINEIV